jgi:hypothetical protein
VAPIRLQFAKVSVADIRARPDQAAHFQPMENRYRIRDFPRGPECTDCAPDEAMSEDPEIVLCQVGRNGGAAF